LIIAALSGAGVTITVAIVGAVLGLRLSDAERRAADARVAEAQAKAQLVVAAANEAAHKQRAELTERRLRDADALISEMVRDLPVDGAFERLLRSYSRARSLDGTGSADTGGLPKEPSTGSAGSDDLLKPGE
jgi:hypothetical protein